MLHIMNAASVVKATQQELELRARAGVHIRELRRLQEAERAALREQTGPEPARSVLARLRLLWS